MINIPPSVNIVTVYQTKPHTGSLDALFHCTRILQAVGVSMLTLLTLSGGPPVSTQLAQVKV